MTIACQFIPVIPGPLLPYGPPKPTYFLQPMVEVCSTETP
jgi:hypothetical protein